LTEILIRAQIVPQKKDVREFADKTERAWGWGGKGVVVADALAGGRLAPDVAATLEPFVHDDVKKTETAKKKYEEEKAKRPVPAGTPDAGDAGSIPAEEPQFLAEITTRLYEDPAFPRTSLVYYVIGGGVGYTVTVSAARDDFYTVLPLTADAVKALKLDSLSGGRYALPDAKALAEARMGIIMGKVLANGRPIPGAGVGLYTSADARAKGVPSFQTRANSYGEYTFTQLTPGRYYLLEVYGVSDAGERVRSVQPITNIDVSRGRVTFVNVEVTAE
jgi:hypothetical protein